MAANENLTNKIRETLARHHLNDVEEKKMFRGTCFMVNGKMCVCVSGGEMLCRIGPKYTDALEEHGVRGMIRNGKTLKDFVFVSDEAMKTKQEFDYWIDLALAFNKYAKATKK